MDLGRELQVIIIEEEHLHIESSETSKVAEPEIVDTSRE